LALPDCAIPIKTDGNTNSNKIKTNFQLIGNQRKGKA
jgi:hypothetical protein